MRRAVITGLGIVFNIGSNQQEALASLHEGYPGTTFSQELKDSGMYSRARDSVRLDTTGLTSRKAVRFISDAFIYAFLPMEQAIVGAGLSPEAYQNNPRAGLTAGSGGGSPRFQVFGADAMRGPRGPKAAGPYVIIKVMASGVSACLAAPFRIHDVNYSISPAYATFTYCIGNVVEQIQLGKQDIVLAGGGEELCWEMACEFDATDAPLIKYNNTPERASRTCDTHRDGLTVAGGGGMVVVEELEHALARGVHIYAETAGYGVTSDDADMAVPFGEGAMHCMKMAVYGVDIPIDYLNPHGTSTPAGDVKRLAAIREVFGDKGPTASTTKAMTGRSLGTADVQEVTYPLLVLGHGFIVPSISIEELDEQVVGLSIATGATDRELTTVMSNSFGFGGTNATLIMRKLRD